MAYNPNPKHPTPKPQPLIRGIGLSQALALNINQMVGVGPFITIPLLVAAMGGPQAMLGWVAGALLAFFDGLVWAELSSQLPGSGGTYVYHREAYGPRGGRLMSFLLIWQVCFHAPLSFASGAIGFSNYLAYLVPSLGPWQMKAVSVGLGLFVTFLLYRRITTIGKMGMFLLAGVLLTMAVMIAAGLKNFEAHRLLDFPPGAFRLDAKFWFGLRDASLFAIYDYLGYYSVCYIGDEVKDAARTIPRAILWAVGIVAVLYLTMNVTVLGSMSWQEVARSKFVASTLTERAFGAWAARLVTVLVMWTAFASIFALLLANSRIPYAAALDGNFFPAFARVHPREHFPNVALVVMGITASLFSLIPLDAVIKSLIVIRALVQFIGQGVGVILLRVRRPDLPRPFRMWLYPLPALMALIGWFFIFLFSRQVQYMLVAFALIGAGSVAFLIHQRVRREWPFLES